MKTKVGLFGIGLDTYWPQFEGLLDHLKGYQEQIKDHIASFDVEVIDAGMVDNPVKAVEAAELLKKNGAELVFLYVST
jgi:L-arabinose isomerase